MTIINDNTVVVFTDTELKNILENNNTYNYIYFGDNITLTSGIAISNTKTKVTIDGTYNNITYEFTDQKKLGTNDTIYVNSPLTTEVIVKNLKITGYNYYGVIYVPEATTYKNTITEYNNITYVGPQISFNPVGLTRFIDSNITIQENYATGNEVAECNRIEIGGNTTINHKSTANSAFWFRNSGPSLKILKKANVDFTSEKRELFYGVNNLELTLEEYSTFNLTVYNGLAYQKNGTANTIINENASLQITKTNYTGAYATWYSYGIITLNKDSKLTIINDYPNITTSNYNIHFQTANAGFILNDPKEVILYNSIANIISATNSIPFSYTFSRINLFNNIIAKNSTISKDNMPTYSWYKNTNLSNITGTFTSSVVTITSNNYTEEELTNLPLLSNFNFLNKKILSIGTFPITVNALTDQDTVMSGISNSLASILISYNDVDTIVTCNENGEFNYSYQDPLPEGTTITFNAKENNNWIYSTKKITIVYSGELTLDSATKYFSFKLHAIKENPILCPRDTDVIIKVTDTRVNSSNWKLYATINHDLTSKDGLILKDSLVYVDSDANINVLSTTPTLIYTGESNQGTTKITNVTWNENEGILLMIKEYLENNTEYEAEITWIIEE